MKKLFLIIVLAGLLSFPLISQADGAYKAYTDSNGNGKFDDGEPTTMVNYQGLVPCGGPGELECQFCHLPVMVLRIIDFFLLPPTGIVFIVAVLMLTFGGALIIFSGGNPGRVAKGKTIITAAITGLVIIYTGWIIVNEFFTMIGVSSNFEALQPGKWNEVMFNCPIRLPK